MKKCLITLFFSLFTIHAIGQTYGNEWINYSQQYFKFEITQDGVYRINQADLVNAGIPVSAINPKNFQVFKNGIEQWIYVSGESDNSFDGTDFIEFYGTRNDGSLDEVLYRTPEEHTNPYVSLYTDTSVYFLTWKNSNSTKHLKDFYDGNYTGKTADTYFRWTSVKWFFEDLYDGTPNANVPEQTFSEYTAGEGYVSSNSNWLKQYTLNTPAPFLAGLDAELQTIAIARNNPKESYQGSNHGLGIALENQTNFIYTKEFAGYQTIPLTNGELKIGANQMKDITTLFIGEKDATQRPNSYHSVPFLRLSYNRKFDLANDSFLNFQASSNTFFKFDNYASGKTLPTIYDATNGFRIKGDLSGSQLQFNTQNNNQKELIIFDLSDIKTISSLKPINFTSLPTTTANYLIITNSALKISAQEYADYRQSVSGGGHQVMTIYADKLYDQFYYGYHHPMAVKNSIDYILDQLNIPIEHILILGKGQVHNNIRKDANKKNNWDLIPTLGLPPTDYMFVSSLDGSTAQIRVPIGRVAAKNDAEVRIYLDKVKAHEVEPNGEWKKHIIQVIGGKDATQNATYGGYLNGYFNVAKDSFLGAYRTVFSKNEAVSVSGSLIDDIQASIDSGAGIFNYFGHGSSQVLEVEIGDAKDLNNYAKYPFFVFNGCALGNCYVDNSKGEAYLFEPNFGAITWVAGTGFGFTDPLRTYTQILHEELLRNQYEQTLGKIIQSTINRYQNPNDKVNLINARQLIYQGDPAIKLRLPEQPDLIARNGKIITDFSAVEDIRVSFDLVNIGKTSRDSISVSIFAQNSTKTDKFFEGKFPIPDYEKNEIITIDKSDFFSGLVKFTILIDSTNAISETPPFGETNNSYSFENLFELQKPLLIYPKLNSIVNTSNVEFVFQIANQKRSIVNIEIQLDTTPTFVGNGLSQFSFTTDKNLIEYTAAMPPFSGKDFFYRIRTKTDTVYSDWSSSSFAYLFGKPNGWSEQHWVNLQNIYLNFIISDSLKETWYFSDKLANEYSIETNGQYPTSGFNWNYFRIAGEIDIIYNYVPNGVHVVALHPNNEQRWLYGVQHNLKYPDEDPKPYWGANPQENQKKYYEPNAYTNVYLFNTQNKSDRDSFLNYLRSIPDGYNFMMHNNRITGIEDWEDSIFIELERFGIYNLRTIKESEPFALFGTKGKPENALEKYGDYSNTINPPINQNYQVVWPLKIKVPKGQITTEKIGPSSSWSSVELAWKKADSDEDTFNYAVIGIDELNKENILFDKISTMTFDISSIDSKKYPFIKLKFTLSDSLEYTPLNIDRWTVYYTGVTEGVIALDEKDEISADTIQRGGQLWFDTRFKNISAVNFDTCKALVKLVHKSGYSIDIDTLNLDSILPGKSIALADTLESLDLAGEYQLFVTANYNQRVLEDNYTNNLYYKRFFVETDNKNPLLDVTFDAIHILNRDLVSANTLISISGKDENEYLFIDDPALFNVKIKYPGEDSFRNILPNDPWYSFIPATSAGERATVNYQTNQLPDGIYTLSVKLEDKTGNGSQTPPYIIDFQVINKQTVTNLFPYPNPFTTCTKFVFTCTGSEIPEKVRINIYTISGRLVKQIDEYELGAIRIGNNLTEYCWDGTDDYGDRLANGVYLYKAEVFSDGKPIEQAQTSADNLFVNGFGKIYLAR
ncbi:MAG: hypothetical protein H6607_12820 [Flavobacteriales bacterium]|nr:hypothetical protein [Flavobacteriales bacterium]